MSYNVNLVLGIIIFKKLRLGTVAHVGNPSYLGRRDLSGGLWFGVSLGKAVERPHFNK
jgi:hypothetical protein